MKTISLVIMALVLQACGNAGEKKAAVTFTGKLRGAWALVGTDNANFVIEKNQVTYPETFTSFPYRIHQDSIQITYADYTGRFLVRMRSNDTLVLTGDEEQTYYRIKP